MLAHVFFPDGSEEMFPISGFEYKRGEQSMIFGLIQNNESVRVRAALDCNVTILNDNFVEFETYKVRGPKLVKKGDTKEKD